MSVQVFDKQAVRTFLLEWCRSLSASPFVPWRVVRHWRRS